MKTLVLLIGLAAASAAGAEEYTLHTFRKAQLTPEFWSEGCAFGDFNHDGHADVTAGPFWWEGPAFTQRHTFRPADKTSTVKRPDGSTFTINGYRGTLGNDNDYSDNFYTFARDLNGDGWDDILVVGLPSTQLRVYLNPRGVAADGGPGHWPVSEVFGPVDNESPGYADLTGDGVPELVCNSDGFFGYAQMGTNATQRWTFHPITPKGKWHKYSHGLGCGDLNGDGRADLVEQDGWWEQPAALAGDPVWTFHGVPFAPTTGAAQMLVYDVNGDGLNDVITCLQPHGYGLAWYEQYREGDERLFRPHRFVGKAPAESPYGVCFSQPHALALADVDGDGVKDLLVGKRFWAHGPTGDVDTNGPAVLYGFRIMRGPGGSVDFVPYLIDDASGVGMDIAVGDVDGDRRPDLCVANKRGVFVFRHEVRTVSRAEWEQAQPKRLAAAP